MPEYPVSGLGENLNVSPKMVKSCGVPVVEVPLIWSMCAAVDPFNQLAMWLFPSTANTSNTTGICDKIIIYNYVTQKWSLAEASASSIFSQFVGAYTVELMDIISENLENINAA